MCYRRALSCSSLWEECPHKNSPLPMLPSLAIAPHDAYAILQVLQVTIAPPQVLRVLPPVLSPCC